MSDDRPHPGELFIFFVVLLCVYVLVGVAIGAALGALNPSLGFNDFGPAEKIAYCTLWPVFFIKYLGIGIWNVLVAFWHLITL